MYSLFVSEGFKITYACSTLFLSVKMSLATCNRNRAKSDLNKLVFPLQAIETTPQFMQQLRTSQEAHAAPLFVGDCHPPRLRPFLWLPTSRFFAVFSRRREDEGPAAKGKERSLLL